MSPPPPSASEPRLSVAADGSLIAHVTADRIVLLDGESLTVSGEIGIDPDALGCDVALCGEPLRLVVMSRYAAGGRLHVIDPAGPTAVGELTMRAPLRLAAASGDHVWLLGGGGSTLVDISERDLVLWPLALRAPVNAVGACAGGRFAVSIGGLIEEWDPASRAPARRFRLARPTAAAFLGGGARQVWMIPVEGDRVDVLPLVNVGQPPRIELPEPPARVAADVAHEALVVLGARSGTAYLIDLAGKAAPTAIEGVSGSDVAWLGPNPAVVVVSPGNDVDVVPVTGRARSGGGVERLPPARSPEAPRMSMLTSPSGGTTSAAPSTVSAPSVPARAASPATSATTASPPPATRPPVPAIGDRSGGWREQTRPAPRRPATEDAGGWVTPPEPPTWRDRLASWAQSIAAGTRADAPSISEGPAVVIAERLGLGGELAEALWLVYGAHLAGLDGVAAIDLVAVIGRRWDEALGRGRLAACGALRWRRSRIVLRREVRAALDEASPRAGAWIESGAEPPAQAVAVIAGADVELAAIARWIAPEVGPLLVPAARPRSLARGVLEARVRGGLAIVRWPAPPSTASESPPTALLVVADEATARAAGAPIVATWR